MWRVTEWWQGEDLGTTPAAFSCSWPDILGTWSDQLYVWQCIQVISNKSKQNDSRISSHMTKQPRMLWPNSSTSNTFLTNECWKCHCWKKMHCLMVTLNVLGLRINVMSLVCCGFSRCSGSVGCLLQCGSCDHHVFMVGAWCPRIYSQSVVWELQIIVCFMTPVGTACLEVSFFLSWPHTSWLLLLNVVSAVCTL